MISDEKNAAVDVPPITGLRLRADGDANFYHLLDGNDWVAAIQMNGKFTTRMQEGMLGKVVRVLSQSEQVHPISGFGAEVGGRECTEGLMLRAKALALLQQAEALDGLRPFMVIHEHDAGTAGYLAWNHDVPSEKEASAVLTSEFEVDREEVLTVVSDVTLDEIVGVALSARIQDVLQSVEDQETESLGDSPRM